jgi:hypothetical protein
MRTLSLFLLLCLLAWPVAAALSDPGTVPAGVVRTHATTLPTVPAVPATVPPAEVWLTIFTDPEGATAIIDSAKTVTTTNRVVLAPGTHTIVVLQAGYEDYATKVNLKGGTWTDLRVTLEPLPDAGKFRPLVTTGTLAAATAQTYLTRPPVSRLEIISYPPGARVFLNGSETFETTPVTLYPDPGAYTVMIRLFSYEDNVTDVTLGAGETVIIKTEMFDAGPSFRVVIPANTPDGYIRGAPVAAGLAEYDDCLPGQQCLTVHQVQEMYPQGGYSFANMICGQETLPNGTIHPMYCYIPPPGEVPPAAPVAPGAQEQGGVIGSVLRFFGSLFGRSS